MKQPEPITTRLINIQEASTYTGLAVATLYNMVSQQRIPYVKLGGALRFDRGLLREWITQQTVMPMPGKKIDNC